MRRFDAPLACALSLAIAGSPLAGCRMVPVQTSRELILNAPEREEEIGRRESQRVAAEIGLLDDAELVDYVDGIGQRLALHATRKDVRYRFHVLDAPEPNAFALPGGYVYVSRGLLALMNSEDELACVIGHEIGHVEARHAAQRQAEAARAQLLSILGIAAAAILGGGRAAGLAGVASQGAALSIVARYSREQEHDADRVGQELAARAGWDPAGMASLLRSLDNASRLREGATRLPSYFDSHPSTPSRVAATAARAQGLRLRASPRPSRADVLARTEGLILGASPAAGVFVGSRFLHPDLDISLRFPERWTLANQNHQVGAVAPEGDALITLEHQGRGESPRKAALAYTVSNRIVLEDAEALTLGGWPAYRGTAISDGARGKVGLDLTWIAHRGSLYRLTGVAPLSRAGAYTRVFRRTAQSFRALTGSEREGIQVVRLRVVEARAGETLADLSRRARNIWSDDRTAVANALFGNPVLEAGQLVKVAEARPYEPPPPGAGDAARGAAPAARAAASPAAGVVPALPAQ